MFGTRHSRTIGTFRKNAARSRRQCRPTVRIPPSSSGRAVPLDFRLGSSDSGAHRLDNGGQFIDGRRTGPASSHTDKKTRHVRSSTARLSLATARKQNPTFTWWPRASRGGVGTPRPSGSLSPSLSFDPQPPLASCTRMCRCTRTPLCHGSKGHRDSVKNLPRDRDVLG